jgi:DNA-binding transcriptional ArsR family regulator
VLVCEVLADESRVQIVEMLARRDLTAGEIAEQFSVSRPAISKHLRVLRDAGLVSVTPEANRRIYRLEPAPLDELTSWAERQRRQWERRLGVLGTHLERKRETKKKESA